MKSLFLAFITLLFTSATLAAVPAQTMLAVPPAPQVAAKSYILVDFNSGQTLIQADSNQRIEPASLTKLMTAYITFNAIKQNRISLNQALPVSEKAWRTEGSRMFIDLKTPVTVAELIRGMIVQSGNDACIALAEAIAGSEESFAHLMNQEAARLGMKNTNFVNSTGLPNPQHYTTAYDLSLLAAAIIRDFPEFYPLYSIKEYRYNNITQPNRNRLLWLDPNVDGMKTGHTESAGYCLITSAKRGSTRLISVVLGTASDNARTMESQKLLNFGFQFFDSVRIYAKEQAVANLRVWKGSQKMLKAGFKDDKYIIVPKGQYQNVKVSMTSTQPLLAPISNGQKIGSVKLTLDGKELAEYPLFSLENVAIANIFGRSWDSIKLMFTK
ncbi:D-alanyl-D-alanine carboxypeptidase family protein [Sulfurirhabdus autotrophica]|uniref:serine-type D-Ala-D-Ala carboxypeptidase n=1 Tax=Sulfurirhabdus autotrophica TaxID=1706046 RepID=A0A4R3Y913_9PROT|nr:D-alanyl-D-alanine carboxypeptidase family protein [Sulfurirhabdus autotrophica]TCV88172.1 penicillin-binding protein 6 [Sulfurirhabdus autotrophica]